MPSLVRRFILKKNFLLIRRLIFKNLSYIPPQIAIGIAIRLGLSIPFIHQRLQSLLVGVQAYIPSLYQRMHEIQKNFRIMFFVEKQEESEFKKKNKRCILVQVNIICTRIRISMNISKLLMRLEPWCLVLLDEVHNHIAKTVLLQQIKFRDILMKSRFFSYQRLQSLIEMVNIGTV